MFDTANPNMFLYVVMAAAVALGLLWFFVIAPFERRNHERKLALLQERIKKRADAAGAATDPVDNQEPN
jgi:hypothetical protein